MAQRRTRPGQLTTPNNTQLLRFATARLNEGKIAVDLNAGKLWVKYGEDVDLLTIRFREHPRPTRSKSDGLGGIIYNYEGDDLVSVEILDITDKFTEHVA
ncbi:MAG: DUF2283 domain-containing protein [Pyrinomonadaceae bacterium MAG19_C2-C3]|nr:DUF2283 domain-containing protein [Pyrinomonadaceae bacterium MAG19_C2-C3]